MNETSKSAPSRLRNEDHKYLRGRVLDVGCGPDLLQLPPGVPGTVTGWDLPDGDAQYLRGVPDNTYDAVHSSHCLEHVVDVATALHHWARVVKPNGAVYIVVPSWELYEHKTWPSRGNADHKSSFSLMDPVVLPDHSFFTVRDMIKIGAACNLFLVDARIACDNYDFKRMDDVGYDQTLHGALAQIVFVYRKLT